MARYGRLMGVMLRQVAAILAAGAIVIAQTDTPPRFEAASIKFNRTMSNSRNGIQTSPGRLTVDNEPFLDLIEDGYRLSVKAQQ